MNTETRDTIMNFLFAIAHTQIYRQKNLNDKEFSIESKKALDYLEFSIGTLFNLQMEDEK